MSEPPPVVDVAGAVDPAVEVLRRGGVIVVPTDTVYGLAARAADARGTAALFSSKGRDRSTPIAVLCADTEQALGLTAELEPWVRALADRHWPGALTLVLRRRRDLRWDLGEPADTLGLRCPDHELVRTLAAAVGPLATTSANRHGVPTPSTAAAAAAGLLGPVDLVVDGGTLAGRPSTVVDCTGTEPVVLRHGAVQLDR